jgi:16S rRNA U516 pseudouridylate synthase RsuA-like enzyme
MDTSDQNNDYSTKTISITITEKLDKQIKELSQQREQNVSQLIRLALKKFYKLEE